MLALNKYGNEFYGLVGQHTGAVVNGVAVSIGDIVSVEPEPSVHNSTGGIVAIFGNKFSVMGIGSIPISKLKVTSIVSSHKDLKVGDYAGVERDFLVVNWED